MNDYELIDHTADIGIRVWGQTREALFTNAGRAMFDLIADKQTVVAGDVEQVAVTGTDMVDLMINWLRELLFLWTGKERLVESIRIESLSDREITGRVTTDPFDPKRHVIGQELKAVTYHQARVDQTSDGWVAEVIFDV